MKKFSLEGFKRIGGKGDIAELRHPAGHSVKLNIALLSPKLRGELHALPQHFVDGGQTDQGQTPEPGNAAPNDQPSSQPTGPSDEDVIGAGINAGYSRDMIMHDPDIYARAQEAFAHQQDQNDLNNQLKKNAQEQQQLLAYKQLTDRNTFRVQHGLSPLPLPDISQIPQPTQTPDQATAAAPQNMPIPSNGQGLQNVSTNPMMGMGNLAQQGLGELAAGAQNQMQSEQAQGRLQNQALTAGIQQTQQTMGNYQDSLNQLGNEWNQQRQDLANQHINPEQYWQNKSVPGKIATILGVIAGGIGGMGKSNAALDLYKMHVENNINSQLQNLNAGQNMLSALNNHYQNTALAADHMRLLGNDILEQKLQQASAQTTDQRAKANYDNAIGQIHLQSISLLPQMARQQMLMQAMNGGGAGGNGINPNTDPSQLVPFLVPQERQKEVFGEIKRAQDTAKLAPQIMQAFDNAANYARSAKGAVYNPYQDQLMQLMNPTFQDLEGTVRLAAMEEMKNRTIPHWLYSKGKTDIQRQGLQSYLQSKSSAPTAKGFGIDLNKFRSTNLAQARPISAPPGYSAAARNPLPAAPMKAQNPTKQTATGG